MIKKIVYVITRSDIGGAQNHVSSLITEFVDQYELVLICGSDGALVDSAKAHGVTTYMLPCVDSFNAFSAIRAIAHVFNIEKPDLVHTHSTLASFYGRFAAKISRIKVLYTVHGWHFSNVKKPLKRYLQILSEYSLKSFTDYWITVSKYDETTGTEFSLFKKNRIKTIPNGIDNILIEKKNNESRILNVLFVGRASYQKNCLAAIEIIEKTGPLVRLSIFTSGGMVDELQLRVESSPTRDRIELIINEPNAGLLMGQYDILLVTSRYEGMPLSVIEAMRAGLAIISTDVCGMSELIINNMNGYLFQQNQQIEMASKLDGLTLDREALSKLCVESKKIYLEKFTLKQMINETQKVYDLLL